MYQRLNVWGYLIACEGFLNTELVELDHEFYGAAFLDSSDIELDHSLIRLPALSVQPMTRHHKIVRHSGGSKANKIFTDGRVFDVSQQAREATVLGENCKAALYDLDGVLCVASPNTTVLAGQTLPRYVLTDLVENLLLAHAKRKGWVQCHAAAWSERGKAQVVVGGSGAGKTTRLMQAVMQGHQFISNDRIFFRRENDVLQVRGFPLPVNIGCGTIRSTHLALPHFDLANSTKIRLTPQETFERFKPDYMEWFEVERILVPDEQTLSNNLYWDEDPSHPFWNYTQRSARDAVTRSSLWKDIISVSHFTELLASEWSAEI